MYCTVPGFKVQCFEIQPVLYAVGCGGHRFRISMSGFQGSGHVMYVGFRVQSQGLPGSGFGSQGSTIGCLEARVPRLRVRLPIILLRHIHVLYGSGFGGQGSKVQCFKIQIVLYGGFEFPGSGFRGQGSTVQGTGPHHPPPV